MDSVCMDRENLILDWSKYILLGIYMYNTNTNIFTTPSAILAIASATQAVELADYNL